MARRRPTTGVLTHVKGLGANYLTEARKEYHRYDKENRLYVNLGDGIKAAMPRYYKTKIFHKDQLREIGMYYEQKAQNEMAELSPEQRDEKMTKWSENMHNIAERERRAKRDLTKYSI